MVLRLTPEVVVDDLRKHAPETVEQLRALLAAGGVAQADPHRKHFYELEGDSQVFYIYVFPRGGKVLLLATWPKDTLTAVPACDRAAD